MLAALASPHLLYALVWLHPAPWRSVFGKRAVPALEAGALVGKGEFSVGPAAAMLAVAHCGPRERRTADQRLPHALCAFHVHTGGGMLENRPPTPSPLRPSVAQFWAAAAWWTARGGSLSPAGTPPAHVAAGLLLVVVGQVLNAAVYRTIGGDGVYYGARLGRVVPWVHGFPYRLFRGASKRASAGVRLPHPQYVGSAATVLGAALAFRANAPPGAGAFVAYWCALYAVTAVQEDWL